MPPTPFVARVRARFQDTDIMAHVHHAAFLTLLEEGRFELLRAIYGGSAPIPKFVMARVEMDYVQQVQFGDDLDVELAVCRFGNASFDIDYRMWRTRDRELVARGKTVQVWLDYATGKPIPIEPEFKSSVEKIQGEIGPLP